MAIKERQRFQRLAALELPKDAREHRAEPLGGDRVKDFAHIRVARDALNAVDGLQIALGPLLVKGEERGRFEGKHRERCHQRIRQSNIWLAQAVIRDVSKAVAHYAKEGISREMRAGFRNNHGHEPLTRTSHRSSQGIFSHRCLRKASAADPGSTGLGGSAGIAGETGTSYSRAPAQLPLRRGLRQRVQSGTHDATSGVTSNMSPSTVFGCSSVHRAFDRSSRPTVSGGTKSSRVPSPT